MPIFLPSNRIPSNMQRLQTAMSITMKPVRHWSLQNRMDKLTAVSVGESRMKSALHLEDLQRRSKFDAKKPTFLIVKKKNKKLVPIMPMSYNGPIRRFTKVESIVKLAKELGRETVRVINGACKKDYPVAELA